MSRAVRLAALAGLVIGACSYAPSPESGTQSCGPMGGKRCPDGYSCGLQKSSEVCFRNDGGGASGAAGRGTAGTTDGGASGAGGAGGAAALPVCAQTSANSWTGSFSEITSGGVPGPTYTLTGSQIEFTGTITATSSGTANVGDAFTFATCVDVSAFSGVSFSVTGSVGGPGCQALFQVDDVERSGGATAGPAISLTGLSTVTPQSIKFPWTTSGGSPVGPIDAEHLAILVWGVSVPASSTCTLQLTVGDLIFY